MPLPSPAAGGNRPSREGDGRVRGPAQPARHGAYIADVYNDGGIALLEAGTGVGKSFAYLVPALEWARANGERTIVSTNTINLQEQLVGKDLPILARAFSTGERAVTFALLKGWRNYVCLSRLEQARAGQESLFDDARATELESIASWASRTADGSLADLAKSRRAMSGTRSPPSRICARGSNAPTSISASCLLRDAEPPKPMSWS